MSWEFLFKIFCIIVAPQKAVKPRGLNTETRNGNMDIMERVRTRGLVLDGALGTQLMARGFKGDEAAEAWNLDHPEVIRSIHRAYFEAGSDVATANTFGATEFKLKKTGNQDRMEAINRAGVRLARAAAPAGQYIAGELGPLGEMLAPMGTMTEDLASELFKKQAAILEDEGVDYFIIQTMFDLNEALIIVAAVQAVSSKPVFCGLTFQETKKGFFTLMGNPVGQSMQQLRDAGAAVVGANCAMGSDMMVDLAREIRESVEIPVTIQPNAGMPQTDAAGNTTYPETVDYFVENILKIKALGVEVVGGCCGTNPEYIQKIRERI